jgi:hypothetical protein
LLLKIIKFTKNSNLDNLNRFFESNFDFKYRNRLELLNSILEIELSRLSSRVDTNYQDSSRILDSNSITRPDAISLLIRYILR